MPGTTARLTWAGVIGCMVGLGPASPARADGPAKDADVVTGAGVSAETPPAGQVVDPARVRGIERPALKEGDAGREAAAGVLFVPRELVKLSFVASGLGAGLIRDEQIVPRVVELFSPRPGGYSVLPSLFLDSRRRARVGAQLLANSHFTAMRLAVGFGGVHDLIGEARLRWALHKPVPFVITVEGLADSRSTLDYFGLGQQPDSDARNHFSKGAPTHDALYFEERERGIVTLASRFGKGEDFEVFLSSSILRSYVTDTPGGGSNTVSRVFTPGSVPGAPSTFTFQQCPHQSPGGACPVESLLSYTELALRFDTRADTGQPSPGVLLESYGGGTVGVGGEGEPLRFYRVGGRAAGFLSVLRKTNILSAKVVLDGTVRPSGAPPVPFTQLVGQPDFRGNDSRIDSLSMVASIDYRWSLVRYVGPRLFIDMAQVGPDLGHMLNAVPRFAGGFGVDVFSSDTELAQTMISFSNEGVRVLFTFGIPTQFGDRQHRR
jgi:hypothetical protein